MLRLRIGTFWAPGSAARGASLAPVPLMHVAAEKVVCATKPEAWPTAVTVKVRPRSVGSGENCLSMKPPWGSATVAYTGSGPATGRGRGGHASSWMVISTVSPGCQ